MRVIKAPIKAKMHDLTQYTDVNADESAHQMVHQLRRAKSYGFLVIGPKGGKDRLAVVLRPTAFNPPAVQAEHWCFIWNGDRIHQIFQFKEGAVIDPNDLLQSSSRSAA
jgi:hypothetical protein